MRLKMQKLIKDIKIFLLLFCTRIFLLFKKIKNFVKTKLSFKNLFTWDKSESLAEFRIKFLNFIFLTIFVIITIKLIVIAASEYVHQRQIRDNKITNRLDIIDRNNNLLAVNLPTSSLYANPSNVIDPESCVKKLQKIIPDLNAKEILSKLKSDKSFVWIKRDITPEMHEKIYNLGLPAFDFEREQKRIYIHGDLFSHIIGYVGRDFEGMAGIEKYYDKFLTENQDFNINIKGKSLTLSVDARLQSIVSEELDKGIKKFNAKGAAAIIVDPNNGEILSLVSKPDFDPHYPGKASENQLFNIVTQGVYELGSSMKSITIAIGLDTSVTSLNDAYNLTYMKVNGFQLKDTHPLKGWNSVAQIFLKSSNIGVSQIMFEIGKNNLSKYLQDLGLFEKVKIQLPEAARSLYQPQSSWTDLSLATMSYGYGMSVSPLHFMQAMMPIVNGGLSYPLTIIKRDENKKLEGKRIFKEKTSMDMRKLLRLVVAKGTGSKSEVKGYYVGGKTGTAEMAVNGKYDRNRRISSFFGVLPASSPKYMIYVMYMEPKGIKETFGFAGGGWVAAPSAGAIFQKLVTLYGIEALDENSPEIKELQNVEYKIDNEV